jgi:hypothetical protein
MTLKLIKTTGGSNGSPLECTKCHQKDFIKSGIAWHCVSCSTYYPTSLGFDTMKKHMEHAESLARSFKRTLDELERIVKE